MKKEHDDITPEMWLGALERLKADSEKRLEQRAKQLWSEVELPCDLKQAISRLTKHEMSTIRQNYEFRNLSALNKADLAEALAKRIPIAFERVLNTLDQSRYDLVKLILSNSGVITDPGMSVSNAQALVDYSLVYPGTHGGQKVLFMPNELVLAFGRLDGAKLQSLVRRNTEWILLVHGLLHFYGVMDAWHLRAKVEELTGQAVDLLELHKVMSFASAFYEQASYSLSNAYRDSRVSDTNKIIEEHRSRPGVDYYPFTKEQLLEAGNPDYVHKSPALIEFFGFLLRYYNLSDEHTHELSVTLTNKIMEGTSTHRIIEYLQRWLEIPNPAFLQRLTDEVQKFARSTPQWALKGHTPAELFEEERKHFLPLPGEPFKFSKPRPSLVDSPTRSAKVGRNDPCPCGSGRKHKKCCGQ